MEPTAAGELNGIPRSRSARTPPISDSGTSETASVVDLRKCFERFGDVFDLTTVQGVFERGLQAAREQQRFALGDDAQVALFVLQLQPTGATEQQQRAGTESRRHACCEAHTWLACSGSVRLRLRLENGLQAAERATRELDLDHV